MMYNLKLVNQCFAFSLREEDVLEVNKRVNEVLDNNDLPSRNSAIIRALKDGYGQAEIERYLDVSAALISYIFRSSNANKKSD